LVIAATADFGYSLIIRAQELQPPDPFTFPFVATYLINRRRRERRFAGQCDHDEHLL